MTESKLKKPIVILKSMIYSKQEITFPDIGTFAVIDSEESGLEFVHVLHKIIDDKITDKVYCRSNFTVTDFIKQCEKLKDDDVFLISANAVLTNMATERSEKRIRLNE